MPRRRPGKLLATEEAVLDAGLRYLRDGRPEFHGFALAVDLDGEPGRRLTAHGTLYKVRWR